VFSSRRRSNRCTGLKQLATAVSLAAAGLFASSPALTHAVVPASMTWATVVNNGDIAPGSTKDFNSYNQPSVNSSGLVTFRARTRGGGGGEPLRGVYSRNPLQAGDPIAVVADVTAEVPQPNNLESTFNEFPSFPRIGQYSNTIATRGQSEPVLKYVLPDLTETRGGTSGVYATIGGTLTTGASLVGAVPGYEYFAVPGATSGTRFSQFPGAPAVDGTTIAFKGNYTDVGTAVQIPHLHRVLPMVRWSSSGWTTKTTPRSAASISHQWRERRPPCRRSWASATRFHG